MNWRTMSEHKFPWPHKNVLVIAFFIDESKQTDLFRCVVGEHGAFFLLDDGFLSLNERGWIPYAWCEDDVPERDDIKWPPTWTDYLTEKSA